MKLNFSKIMIVLILILLILMISKKSYNIDSFENKDNLFFVHIPKNAGTSIEDTMKENFNLNFGRFYKFPKIDIPINNDSLWHIPPKYFLGNNPYKNKILFLVVRNPYERILSKYKYDCNNNQLPPNKKDLNKFINNIPKKIKNNKFQDGCHYLPQYEFLDYDDAAKYEILKMENLDSDFQKFLKKYNFPEIKLKRNNSTKKSLSILDLDKESIKIINNIYKIDFIKFNYKIISP